MRTNYFNIQKVKKKAKINKRKNDPIGPVEGELPAILGNYEKTHRLTDTAGHREALLTWKTTFFGILVSKILVIFNTHRNFKLELGAWEL